jgi:mRNA-degrading endonuclease RelE of RelBE toxin-antitoxin system
MKFVPSYLLRQLATTIAIKKVKKVDKSCQKSCQQIVKKLSKSCQKIVKKLSKSCQKVVKKLLKKLSKSCQKVVKNFVSPGKNQKKSQKKSSSGE